jgi:hypothetical protein
MLILILSHSWVGYDGTLPWIDYEGIELTLAGGSQDFFDASVDPISLHRALESGLRGEDLIPALLDDFRVWQTCPADEYAPWT